MRSQAAIKQAVHREVRKRLPSDPACVADFALAGEWTQTSSGQDFLLVDAGRTDGIFVFASDRFAARMCEASTVHVDGTFACTPKNFAQLCTIHAPVDGEVVPVVYAMLQSRQTAHYVRFLRLLCDALGRKGLRFAPKQVVFDFEPGLLDALRQVFPGVEVKGASVHMQPALVRKAAELGLKKAYGVENGPSTPLKEFVRDVVALQQIPKREVRTMYERLLAEFPAYSDQSLSDSFQLFLAYLEQTWLGANALFQIACWNCVGADSSSRTHVTEGLHQRLAQRVQYPSPRLYRLLYALKEFQLDYEIQAELRSCARPPAKRSKKKTSTEQTGSS